MKRSEGQEVRKPSENRAVKELVSADASEDWDNRSYYGFKIEGKVCREFFDPEVTSSLIEQELTKHFLALL